MSLDQLPDTVDCAPCPEVVKIVFADKLPETMCPCPVEDTTLPFMQRIVPEVQTYRCLQQLLFNMTQQKFCTQPPLGCPE